MWGAGGKGEWVGERRHGGGPGKGWVERGRWGRGTDSGDSDSLETRGAGAGGGGHLSRRVLVALAGEGELGPRLPAGLHLRGAGRVSPPPSPPPRTADRRGQSRRDTPPGPASARRTRGFLPSHAGPCARHGARPGSPAGAHLDLKDVLAGPAGRLALARDLELLGRAEVELLQRASNVRGEGSLAVHHAVDSHAAHAHAAHAHAGELGAAAAAEAAAHQLGAEATEAAHHVLVVEAAERFEEVGEDLVRIAAEFVPAKCDQHSSET